MKLLRYIFPFIHRHNDDNNNDPTNVFVGSHVISHGFIFCSVRPFCSHGVWMHFFFSRSQFNNLHVKTGIGIYSARACIFFSGFANMFDGCLQVLHLLLRISIVIVIIWIRFDFCRDKFRVKPSTSQRHCEKQKGKYLFYENPIAACAKKKIFSSRWWWLVHIHATHA